MLVTMKLLMVAPFETNGRYKGGIFSIANEIIHAEKILSKNAIEIIPFNTCQVQRKGGSQGKINFANLKNFFKGYFRIVKDIKRTNPDVLYFHTSKGIPLLKDLLILNRAKKKTGIKTVLHIHFADYEKIMTGKKLLDNYIMKSLKTAVDRVVFLSNKTREEFVACGLERSKCCVIYNFSAMQFTCEELYEKFNRQVKMKFLFVGSIDKRKGLFDVLETLKNNPKEFELVVCGQFGTDEDKTRFTEYQKMYNKKLKFLGYVSGEEKRKAFLDADVLLLPSHGEGLPIVIVEAMSAGCAVLASNVGAIPEIVGEKNGVLIAPGDKRKLEEALAFYLDCDKALLQAQQRCNFEEAKVYSLETFIENVANVCKQVQY